MRPRITGCEPKRFKSVSTMPSLLRRAVCGVLAWIGFLCAVTLASAEPARVIFDTDMASDVDDVGALAILHALADRGEAEILACGVSSNNEETGPCIEIINTYCGRPDIPIGKVRGLKLAYPQPRPDEVIPSLYTAAVARAFPHRLKRTSDAADAVEIYRHILASQPDRSVTMITVGFLTNLETLLNSRPDAASSLSGEALVKTKIEQWVCMGGKFPLGQFPDGGGEYNVAWDTLASIRAIHDWPTPIVFSGYEIGAAIKVGAKLSARPEHDPIRMSYQYFNGLRDREAWDLTAVLYAVRGSQDLWDLSAPGVCLMHAGIPHGYNEWIPDGHHEHRYLIAKAPTEKVAETLNALLLAAPKKSQ